MIFAVSSKKGAVVTLAISMVTGPILIVFAHDVATILPLNIFKSELPYSYPFRNASRRNEGHLPILPKICCHDKVLRGIGKGGPDRSSTNKCLPFCAKIAKFGPMDPEIIGLQVITKNEKKKLTQAKYIALRASVPSRLNKSTVDSRPMNLSKH